MLEVINNVCAERLMKIDTAFEPNNHGVSTVIQLSQVLTKAFVKDFCKHSGVDVNKLKIDPDSFEMSYVYLNTIWTILNRAYRDDTNDPDVEIELLSAYKNKGK